MQRVPWMCWKRMSDNWKAYILAYAWPVPISSRILWSLLLQNHFKLNRDFFSSCQLESCEILSILVFVLLGNGQVLERNQEQVLAGILYSSWVQPSHLNLETACHERRLVVYVGLEGTQVLQRPNSGHPVHTDPWSLLCVWALPGLGPRKKNS